MMQYCNNRKNNLCKTGF